MPIVEVAPEITQNAATVVSAHEIDISWAAFIGTGIYAGSYTGFSVFRDGVAIVTGLSDTATSYNDTTVSGNHTYVYEIQGAYTLIGHNPVISNDVSATTPAGAPTGHGDIPNPEAWIPA